MCFAGCQPISEALAAKSCGLEQLSLNCNPIHEVQPPSRERWLFSRICHTPNTTYKIQFKQEASSVIHIVLIPWGLWCFTSLCRLVRHGLVQPSEAPKG